MRSFYLDYKKARHCLAKLSWLVLHVWGLAVGHYRKTHNYAYMVFGNIIDSPYVRYMPDKKQLVARIEAVLDK